MRDPRFAAHGVGLCWQEEGRDYDYPIRTAWFSGENIASGLASFDWSQTAVLAHHAHFDGLILAHHYGVRPALWLDTLSMARALVGNHLSVSLESLAKHYGLAAKTVPYDRIKGKYWHEMDGALQRELAEGCLHDCKLTWDIFLHLAASFPACEYGLVDTTVRMFTEPCLVGRVDKLASIWECESRDRAALIQSLSVTPKDLRSNEKFADLLRAEGVEPEEKQGKPKTITALDGTVTTEEREIYAFAATDDFMRDLLDDDRPRVRALAEARVAEKSNIIQTRSSRLGWMSRRGDMCVYLGYCGAHTTRWSGGDKANWQNFPRDSDLGGAIEAPPGHVVVVADASQIELRLLCGVAGQTDVLDTLRAGGDTYAATASVFYGRPINKRDNPVERQQGKIVVLASGYGVGGPKLAAILRRSGVPCTEEQGNRWKDAYRATHPAVVALWKEADGVLKKLEAGLSFQWKCVDIEAKRIYLPNALPLIYDTLEWHTAEDGDRFWRVQTRHGWSKLYGAKLIENLIQALSATHTRGAMAECSRAGMKLVSMEHDKIIAVVPESQGQEALRFMQAALAREPAWLPGIPLDSEGYVSRTFSKKDQIK